MQEMIEIIEEYFDLNEHLFKGKLTITEDKWFNGSSFYPLYEINIESPTLLLTYVFRVNEFQNANALLPSKVDNHEVKILYKAQGCKLNDFEVEETYSLIKLLLKGKNSYKVKSIDNVTKKNLISNESLRRLFETYYDSEFAPIIRGIKIGDELNIEMRFSTIRFHPLLFDDISLFLQSLDVN